MSLTPLLSLFFVCFSLLFYSVDSCSTVSRSGVSLTGVCPNDTFTVPIGTTLTYECSYNFSSGYYPFWNVSGTELAGGVFRPPGISEYVFDGNIGKATITILTNGNITMYIQCGLRGTGQNMDLTSRVRFIETEVVTFGPPSSLSHKLRENDTVKLSWLPPLEAPIPLFTYSIIIMESTTNLPVTDINITNNTYVIISPANIANYTECTSYQWGVRAAASLSYGFTNITMANENFTLISGPKISDELTVIDDNYTIEFNATAPCDIDLLNNYTYTLLQRDYCQTELNSSQLNISIPLDDNVVLPNTMIPISVNIESLIHDSTWLVAVSVSNRFGSDTTDYTNITNNKTNIEQCYSEPISSLSTAIMLSKTVTPSPSPISSIYRSKSGSIQTSMDCTAVIITSTVYITTTPSTNVIPIVIVTIATVMILLIVVIILLIFMILLCYKRSDIAGNRCTSNQNVTVPLEVCPAYDDISRLNTANCEAYGKRDTFITAEYETVNVN
ncbi:PREDICTED: uncharacterized protein LOC109581696 [Amphimedon queenslandica]|uniref:Fibronectin type-III domain-containing protein n=1 Tax=Amphimedon queenslandica TaxID=400682 RepID=A0AAN0J3E6_AMPQE|nr:PREDICTED: uncharacterized protein LOC109581696 [Amphimedon queenslandica]|eukprot:XP_019851569.1 PREDICTED: uncharacterized protein LOC109581696 [Amphimedon queenslandica]